MPSCIICTYVCNGCLHGVCAIYTRAGETQPISHYSLEMEVVYIVLHRKVDTYTAMHCNDEHTVSYIQLACVSWQYCLLERPQLGGSWWQPCVVTDFIYETWLGISRTGFNNWSQARMQAGSKLLERNRGLGLFIRQMQSGALLDTTSLLPLWVGPYDTWLLQYIILV